MKSIVTIGLLILAARPDAAAHRLDEYLQAALLSRSTNRVDIELSLTPGVAVLPVILAMIDTNADGQISASEQRAYTGRVAGELRLDLAGKPLPLRLQDFQFPTLTKLQEGLGTIKLNLRASLSAAQQDKPELRFQNLHAPAISAYMVNCLAPDPGSPGITLQRRDERQSEIRVTYSIAPAPLRLSYAALAVCLIALLITFMLKFHRGTEENKNDQSMLPLPDGDHDAIRGGPVPGRPI